MFLASEALKNFQKSLMYTNHIKGDEMNLSSTHLNMWALFSQLGNHELAYKHGKIALKLLPAAYKRLKQIYPPDEDGIFSKVYEEQKANLIMTMVIAYYNTGTECEYLKK